MKTAANILKERRESDARNKAQARKALLDAAADFNTGLTLTDSLKNLTKSERKCLRRYAEQESMDQEQILRNIHSNPASTGEVAESIYTRTGRQSDGERSFQRYQALMVQEQDFLLDPNGVYPTKMPNNFLSAGVKGSDWKGLDFLTLMHGVAELVAHKYTNGNGGSQGMSHGELMRLIQRSSPCRQEPEPCDDPLNHRPEETSIYFRKGVESRTKMKVEALIVSAIQDGAGREDDIRDTREMAIPSLYKGSPLLAFCGTREEYSMVRPLLFILSREWKEFTVKQQEGLQAHIEIFHETFPEGFHGLYGNPHAPWEVLKNMANNCRK